MSDEQRVFKYSELHAMCYMCASQVALTLATQAVREREAMSEALEVVIKRSVDLMWESKRD